jgi:hypothetical protein
MSGAARIGGARASMRHRRTRHLHALGVVLAHAVAHAVIVVGCGQRRVAASAEHRRRHKLTIAATSSAIDRATVVVSAGQRRVAAPAEHRRCHNRLTIAVTNVCVVHAIVVVGSFHCPAASPERSIRLVRQRRHLSRTDLLEHHAVVVSSL